MTDVERQWRLHIENRLQELRTKHGTDMETAPMPAWLDSLEGALQRSAVDQPQPETPVHRSPPFPENGRVVVGVLAHAVDGGSLERDVPRANFEDLDV